ncbi:MAG: Methyltransferase FkbM family [uncultured bacterium]|uniref:Methyltransferase FkbM domain-containing protein n=1 Tax=Candidatus Wolfebacteria bacterium GW2011_GWC2_39_22 TaxID=1619013 RepID=A0A0G0N8Y2_9BACT|nr:MAG: Methyltransferase FkbM family [uncultured bacterium]KKR12599.1 MAG: hypothetical protein UT41_C0001G0143 [Candidatus Wolfebacteria bacterium GW2011_GWC2_39_22]HBI25800.1 hypothetical protein [Candidatus Wolfebacteria bacterium]
MFKYQQQTYNKIFFNASDLIQYDVEVNLPLLLGKQKEEVETIIVVGAWQGDEVRAFLRFPNANIHCFEANPKTYSILAELYKDEERVHCYNYACSDSDGTAIFHETTIDGNGSLLEVGDHPAAKGAGSFEVKTIRLDSLSELADKKIDLLQIDVQGAELSVLGGAEQLLKHVSALLIEVNSLGGSYKGAATFAEVDSFVRQRDLLLVAQGLDQEEVEGNALYLQKECPIFDTDSVDERVKKIIMAKMKKREVYRNPIFKAIHKLTPQSWRTKLKKIIRFN